MFIKTHSTIRQFKNCQHIFYLLFNSTIANASFLYRFYYSAIFDAKITFHPADSDIYIEVRE